MIAFLRFALLNIFFFASQYVCAQDTPRIRIPRADNPRASLTVLFNKVGKELPNIRAVPPGRATYLPYYLFSDGTFGTYFPLRKGDGQPVSPDNVRVKIMAWGMVYDHTVLELHGYNRDVDFSSLVKAIQGLNGVEKEFDLFQVDVSFPKASPESEKGIRHQSERE